jgi:hypothetical protein
MNCGRGGRGNHCGAASVGQQPSAGGRGNAGKCGKAGSSGQDLAAAGFAMEV